MSLTGIILAGGKSQRMGQDKAFIQISGKPMIQYVIDHLKPLVKALLISANDEGSYEKFGYPVIEDKIKNAGPAGGIMSCLLHMNTQKSIVISCDLPYVSTPFLTQLSALSYGYEITIVKSHGFLQPLCGIYSKDIEAAFRSFIEDGKRSMHFLVQQFNLNVVDQEQIPDIDFERALKNINSKNDL